MPCPLSPSDARDTLTSLPLEFDTLEFIQRCPHSGGTRDGVGCAAVRDSGNRQVCGRGVASFARSSPDLLAKMASTRPPARWRQAGSAPAQPRQAPVSQPAAPSQWTGGWAAAEQRRQVQWKESVQRQASTAGVTERGIHQGQAVDYLFPADQWAQNLHEEFRQDVLDHLEVEQIAVHDFSHHVRSSQAFALNLAAPFFARPARLGPILSAMLPPNLQVARVDKVEAEVVDPRNRFGEPGQRGAKRTSSDLGIWWTDSEGKRCLLLVEVKYTEAEFGACSKGARHGGRCDSGGPQVLASGGSLCPLSDAPHRRTYWPLMQQLQVFQEEALASSQACPFRHDGYQLMRNQLLAAVLEADPELDRVDFAVMMHDDNAAVRRLGAPLAGSQQAVDAWRGVLRRPSRFHDLSPRQWLQSARKDPTLRSWADAMLGRYFAAPAANGGARPPAVTPGHRAAVQWLASPKFAEIKAAYDLACGPGAVYFRAVDGVINVISLHPSAPRYLGHRTSTADKGYILKPTTAVPDVQELRRRDAEVTRWLLSVGHPKAEEQAVMPWLRGALTGHLWLPDLGPGWALLNQEWRFVDDDGQSRKSDVLAVHLPTGQLGIVEAKSRDAQLPEARLQVRDYARLWRQHARELAPLFTEMLRAMGGLYANPAAAQATVATSPAALFVAAPGPTGLRVEEAR